MVIMLSRWSLQSKVIDHITFQVKLDKCKMVHLSQNLCITAVTALSNNNHCSSVTVMKNEHCTSRKVIISD